VLHVGGLTMNYDFSVLRELRRRKDLTIEKLSEASDISYVAISKLERNQGNPELRTLDRISRALGLSVQHLLAMAERQPPARVRETVCTVLGQASCRYVDLDGTRLFVIQAPKGASGDESDRHGADYERCFVLDGRVKVTVRGNEHILESGHGLVWDCLHDHTYEVMEPASFIMLLTPKKL